MNPCIYSISCPDTNKVRYIGRTYNPSERFKQHLRASNHKKYADKPLYKWIAGLLSIGKAPVFKIERECCISNICELERQYILLYASTGLLFNEALRTNFDGDINRDDLIRRIKSSGMTFKHISAMIGINRCSLTSYCNIRDVYLPFDKVEALHRFLPK
jgi:hypothetical protein